MSTLEPVTYYLCSKYSCSLFTIENCSTLSAKKKSTICRGLCHPQCENTLIKNIAVPITSTQSIILDDGKLLNERSKGIRYRREFHWLNSHSGHFTLKYYCLFRHGWTPLTGLKLLASLSRKDLFCFQKKFGVPSSLTQPFNPKTEVRQIFKQDIFLC